MTGTDVQPGSENPITSTEGLKNRSAHMRETRKAKLDRLYLGQRYTIVKEIHLEGDARFETPLGNKGRNGFAIVNEDPTQEGDKAKHIVGATLLALIAKDYGAVDLPPAKRKRKPTTDAFHDATLDTGVWSATEDDDEFDALS